MAVHINLYGKPVFHRRLPAEKPVAVFLLSEAAAHLAAGGRPVQIGLPALTEERSPDNQIVRKAPIYLGLGVLKDLIQPVAVENYRAFLIKGYTVNPYHPVVGDDFPKLTALRVIAANPLSLQHRVENIALIVGAHAVGRRTLASERLHITANFG